VSRAAFIAARPIAHRGLHEAAAGIIENCPKAFAAAISGNYAIECDVQLSADSEAMVFHDFTLDRLTHETGAVNARNASALKQVRFKATDDSMLTLGELFKLVAGRVPLVVEIKSSFGGDLRLVSRAAEVASSYAGPLAFMSFDPAPIAWLKMHRPDLIRGIVAQSDYGDSYWSALPADMKKALAAFSHHPETDADFVSWRVADLPAPVPVLYRSALARPVICWTVRSEEDRAIASRYADQVTFEGYRA